MNIKAAVEYALRQHGTDMPNWHQIATLLEAMQSPIPVHTMDSKHVGQQEPPLHLEHYSRGYNEGRIAEKENFKTIVKNIGFTEDGNLWKLLFNQED